MRNILLYSTSALIIGLALSAYAGTQKELTSMQPTTVEDALNSVSQLKQENDSLKAALNLISRLKQENESLKAALNQGDTEISYSNRNTENDPINKTNIKQITTNPTEQKALKKPEPKTTQIVQSRETREVGNIETENTGFILQPRLDTFAKLGKDRSLLGTQLFYPLGWNGRRLTYTDIRLIADNQHDFEGNIGLGLRYIPKGTDMLLGTYGFFDHRKSSADNFYSQITLGAELLTPDYDFRINSYQSLNGAKTISNSSQTSLRFVGSNLLADQRVDTQKEVPLSGFDAEAGIKLPFLKEARIYGGAFHFSGDEDISLTGLRSRVRWRVNDWFQLGLEHQWDDIRGNSDLAEFRIRIPLGKKPIGKKPTGIYARLNEDIVRDIDIVTQAVSKTTYPVQGEKVVNNDTNSALKVYHVDNTAAAGGNGTAENPYDTLSAATTASTANGMIYVHAGDGTNTGQNSGATLNKVGQKLIGSGTSLTLASMGLRVNGLSASTTVLEATSAPTIGNTSGNGITISADDVQVAGVKVSGTTGHGIYVANSDNVKISNSTIDSIGNGTTDYGIYTLYTTAGPWTMNVSDNTISNNFNTGLYIRAQNAANVTSQITNNTISGNGAYGAYIRGESTSVIDNAISGNTISGNTSHGIYMNSTTTSDQTNNLTNNVITGNNAYGVYMLAQNSSTMDTTISDNSLLGNFSYGIANVSQTSSSSDATIRNNRIKNNASYGVYLNAQNSSTQTNLIDTNAIENNSNYGLYAYTQTSANMTTNILNNTITGNSNTGLYLRATNSSTHSGLLQGNTMTYNSGYGAYIDDDSTIAMTADLGGGGLSSTGNNSIFANTLQDIRVDLNGAELKAENNWWGTAAGLQTIERTLDVGSTIDSDPFLTADPNQ
ncbi:MAG TPA: right-handed parallel beta-helix repeat-containing protein [Alphaproteobacteria bacterium]|nr:right-handed parallel beta-helix repeat-containing protein [Alphaproteobacteria bacterium]